MRSADDPPLLTRELLGELEQRWNEQGAFVAKALQPGLRDEDIDRLTGPVGLHLPLEARRWWQWHDGAEPQGPGAAAELGPERAFLPLARAVRECERIRDLMRYAWEGDLGPDWQATWLPIDVNKRPTVFDCGVGVDDPVPVRSFFMEVPTAGEQGVRSIGELVSLWIEAIDTGVWSYNRSEDHWEYNLLKLKPEIAELHLV